jgi:hypothetical protein
MKRPSGGTAAAASAETSVSQQKATAMPSPPRSIAARRPLGARAGVRNPQPNTQVPQHAMTVGVGSRT